MATFPGSGASDWSLVDYTAPGYIHTPEFVEHYFDPLGLISEESEVSSVLGGVLSKAPSSALKRGHTGGVVPTFSLDYYNRIHVTPVSINFGSVLNEITTNVEIWNAFFEDSTWTGQTTIGFDGLGLDPADIPDGSPIVFGPLRNAIVDLTAYLEGPGVISAQLQFLITGREVPVVTIVGRRSKLFPFVTSWDRNPVEKFEWKTNIVATEEGIESRYRLRKWPRRSFQFGLAGAGSSARDLRVSLQTSQDSSYELPLWMYSAELTEVAIAGTTTLFVDTDDSDFYPGEKALLYVSPEIFESVDVGEVFSNRLEIINTTLQRTWQPGTQVCPIRSSRFDDVIQFTAPVGNVSRAIINLDALNSEKNFDDVGLQSYLGIPVLTSSPNWENDRSFSYGRLIDTVDNQIHPKKWYVESQRYWEEQDFYWFLNGREAVKKFKAMVQMLAGRQNTIWLPSWQEDFALAEDYAYGSSTITVKGDFATKHLAANIVNPTHVRLLTLDGTMHFSRLLDAKANVVFSYNEDLTIDGWAADIPKNWVENFCLMSLVRLTSDVVEIEWLTPQMAKATTRFRYVPEQPE